MTQQASEERRKLTILEQVICAWPMVLIFIGGAIGGACGGAAWVINTRIMGSSMAAPMRYGLVVLTGLIAGALWFVAVMVLTTMFPSVFGGK